MTSAIRRPGRRDRRRAGLRAALLLAVAGVLGFAPQAPASADGAVAAADAREAGGPLDLTRVALEQRDVRMFLRVATAGGWTGGELAQHPMRALCVTLVHGTPATPRGRICATGRGNRSALSYARLGADGRPLATRRLVADVSRPSPGVLEATFLPAAAGLSPGPYAWFAHSAWIDAGGCARTCADRVPDAGAVDADMALLGVPRCFGAAARDPLRPCENPDLRLSVQPPPSRPRAILDSYCDSLVHVGLLSVCGFATAADEAQGTFLLLGDSHAASLKTALEVVTLARRWRGISVIRAGCPPTLAGRPILRTRRQSRQCAQRNRQALAWLADHREVDTVFLSAHTRTKVRATRGRSAAQTRHAGYREMIRALLRLGRRVVVIRDPPRSRPGHLRCVSRALRARRPPGAACGLPRSAALRPDPLARAAAALRGPRVTVVDLTRHFCGARRCLAVVGGALVHRDETHLTPAFSATLGPYILRAIGG